MSILTGTAPGVAFSQHGGAIFFEGRSATETAGLVISGTSFAGNTARIVSAPPPKPAQLLPPPAPLLALSSRVAASSPEPPPLPRPAPHPP